MTHLPNLPVYKAAHLRMHFPFLPMDSHWENNTECGPQSLFFKLPFVHIWSNLIGHVCNLRDTKTRDVQDCLRKVRQSIDQIRLYKTLNLKDYWYTVFLRKQWSNRCSIVDVTFHRTNIRSETHIKIFSTQLCNREEKVFH